MDKIISLAPFNYYKLQMLIGYLSIKHYKTFNLYSVNQFHVLVDAIHVIKHGSPVVGGRLDAWHCGPMFPDTYHLVNEWFENYDKSGEHPDELEIVETESSAFHDYNEMRCLEVDCKFKTVYADEFSKLELESLDFAWKEIGNKTPHECNLYLTDDKGSFLGEVYSKAIKNEDKGIDWLDVIGTYERWHDVECRLAKLAVKSWSEYD